MTTIAKLNRPSRRALLKSGGALVVSIGAPMPLNLAGAAEEARLVGAQPPLTPDQLSSYIAVNADGTISVFFRQDRSRARPRGRARANGCRRTRRAVQRRQGCHWRYREQRQSRRRLERVWHFGRRQAVARRRG